MDKPDYLNQPFQEALDYFLGKIPSVTERWDDYDSEQHDYAFTVAGVMREDILKDIQWLISRMMDSEGLTYDQFEKQFKDLIGKKGWLPSGGDKQQQRRLYIIADTNIRQAYKRGQIEQFKASGLQDKYLYGIWIHRDSPDPRHNHKQLHNKAILLDSPFYQQVFAPHGFGCRCKVQFANDRLIKRLGATIISPPDPTPYLEKGFGGLKLPSINSEIKSVKNS